MSLDPKSNPASLAAKAHMDGTIAMNDSLRAIGSKGLSGVTVASIDATNAGIASIKSSEVFRS